MVKNRAFIDLVGPCIAFQFKAVKHSEGGTRYQQMSGVKLSQVGQDRICCLVKRRSLKQRGLYGILDKEDRGSYHQHHVFLRRPVQHMAVQMQYSQVFPVLDSFFNSPRDGAGAHSPTTVPQTAHTECTSRGFSWNGRSKASCPLVSFGHEALKNMLDREISEGSGVLQLEHTAIVMTYPSYPHFCLFYHNCCRRVSDVVELGGFSW